MALPEAALPPADSARRAYALILLAVLAAVVVARVRLLGVPLERDEGEFAYQALLLLKAVPPFAGLYTMKLPGVGMLYAVFVALFGMSVTAIRLGFLACNVLSVVLLWRLGRRLLGPEAGLAAAAAFALLSVSQGVLGILAHATQFVVLFSLAAFLLLLRLRDGAGLATACATGFCFGWAILMKQHALFLAIFGLVVAVAYARRRQRTFAVVAAYGAGVALPLLALAAWLAIAGTAGRAWLWCVEYASRYVSLVTPGEGLATFLVRAPRVASFEAPLWIAACVGLVLLALRGARVPARLFLLALLVASLAAVSPGFYYRSHYFVLLLPVVALLAAFAITEAPPLLLARSPDSRVRTALGPALLALLLLWGIGREDRYLYYLSPAAVSRQLSWPNPFPEAVDIGGYLRRHTSPEDRIAVLGSEPEIFFYADRLSATGYIYMYGLMEPQPFAHAMQADMIREIEAAKPRYLVFVQVPMSWLVRPDSDPELLRWAPEYAARHYRLEGLVDLRAEGTKAYWGEDAQRAPQSPYFVTVWRRDTGSR